MSEFFDRAGNPMTLDEWVASVENRDDKRIAETTLPDGRWVSTVWLGINHRFFDDGPPLIFETMVFPSKDDMRELGCWRWSTEEQARAGHERIVVALGAIARQGSPDTRFDGLYGVEGITRQWVHPTGRQRGNVVSLRRVEG